MIVLTPFKLLITYTFDYTFICFRFIKTWIISKNTHQISKASFMFRIIVHRPSYQQIYPLNHAVYLDVNELSKRKNNTNHHINTFFLRVKTKNLSSINGSFQNVLYFPVQVDTFQIGNSTNGYCRCITEDAEFSVLSLSW